jgi:NTP pyrophosphatase (non-canonical NTP hydrolase)
MTLNELGQRIKAYRESIEVHTPNELNGLMLAKLMRVVMECAEAGEAVRNNDLNNFAEELSDILMLTSDICATMGIDVEAVIEQKLQALDAAPRGKWHGKAIGI